MFCSVLSERRISATTDKVTLESKQLNTFFYSNAEIAFRTERTQPIVVIQLVDPLDEPSPEVIRFARKFPNDDRFLDLDVSTTLLHEPNPQSHDSLTFQI